MTGTCPDGQPPVGGCCSNCEKPGNGNTGKCLCAELSEGIYSQATCPLGFEDKLPGAANPDGGVCPEGYQKGRGINNKSYRCYDSGGYGDPPSNQNPQNLVNWPDYEVANADL
jgi:hypothetical protein